MTTADASASVERSAVREIRDWGGRYLRRHPLESLQTVGGQVVLAVRTIQYAFEELFARRFQTESNDQNLWMSLGEAA